MIKQNLLDILACPQCFEKLIYNQDHNGLFCEKDQLNYAIIDNIPVLIKSHN